jgi:hypothetical protein
MAVTSPILKYPALVMAIGNPVTFDGSCKQKLISTRNLRLVKNLVVKIRHCGVSRDIVSANSFSVAGA